MTILHAKAIQSCYFKSLFRTYCTLALQFQKVLLTAPPPAPPVLPVTQSPDLQSSPHRPSWPQPITQSCCDSGPVAINFTEISKVHQFNTIGINIMTYIYNNATQDSSQTSERTTTARYLPQL